VDKIIFDDLSSGRVMCLAFMGSELWLCYKHPDGQFVTERKATIDDISKVCHAPKLEELGTDKQQPLNAITLFNDIKNYLHRRLVGTNLQNDKWALMLLEKIDAVIAQQH
jgi:hypothetical protein